ncbi:LOW QUALITY PROTEIN: Hypothetical protein PHPALM_6979, partial [Phytophthora palmivora]
MVFSVEERRERHRLAVQRNRAREGPEARAERLRRQRERQQRLRTSRGRNEVHETVEESQQSWLDGGGMLLSKRGIHPAGYIQVCQECNASLAKQLLPKFSIKNGFYVGSLPNRLTNTTLPERLMTQTVMISAVTRVMRGGSHRAIRSHCLAFDSMPGPAATLLPTSAHNISCYRVVMAGPFTTEQHARVRQMHLVRRQMVEDLLTFYCEYNVLYEDVTVDCSGLASEVVAEHLICEEADADVEASDVDTESDRVGSSTELGDADGETDVVEHRVVFIAADREVNTRDRPPVPAEVVELPTQRNSQPQFLVRHSSRFANNNDFLFARMFPHLFPYGRGHPSKKRQIPVSLEACIRYYCQLSSRRFAEDELFTLVGFDHLTVQRMYLQVALKCQRDPARFERYSSISEASLKEALEEKERNRQGRTTAVNGDNSSASTFLKTVELSSGVIWGSDAERAQCRRRAFAYQARYGQPALFATLTPNVADSLVMAHYTGISSVETLFDADLDQLPRRSVLHSASLRNDVASARLFMYNMDAFIEHVLGVPPKHMKNKAFDGLFGDVKAYFGVVETQGGGTLHAHFLVWLVDAPPNSEAFHRATIEYGEQYYQDIANYADSIVSTSLPLDVAASNCRFCGHSFTDLQELPIPAEAYEPPHAGRHRLRAEPQLAQCSQCTIKMSSQHVLRRVIFNIDHRVGHRLYEPIQLNAAVQMQVKCRGNVGAAKAAVFRRDMFLATRDNLDDTYGEHLRALNAVPCRYEQREDDAFRTDKVAQAIMALPPSIDDERWPPNAVAFAVAMLVFMLNLHWWSHVGSCFKPSRASSPGQCRYRFPRDRAVSTSCSSAGVTIARQTPFEYVNGFNACLMLAFKSNHDIQVLIGGLEALLRIYYTTKHVTISETL